MASTRSRARPGAARSKIAGKEVVQAKAHARLPLAALRVFAAVAARRSFSDAAESLNLSTAAVSMQVKALEEYLQVKLLVRNSHGVQLTVEGERLWPYVQRGLDELEQGFRLLCAERKGGVLVASLLSSFLNNWLISRLPDFHMAHPDIDLRLQCSVQLTDFARSDVHVAIRMGRGSWPPLHAEKLFDEYLVPLCTPQLLAKYGPLAGPGPLGNWPLLHSISEPWELWTERRDYGERWPERGAAFDDSIAVLAAAAHGQGLVLSRWSLAQAVLASGQLVPASDVAIRHSFEYYFVCPPAYLQMRKVQLFRQWLFAQATAMEMPARVA